jgi:hypothetical protein
MTVAIAVRLVILLKVITKAPCCVRGVAAFACAPILMCVPRLRQKANRIIACIRFQY